MSLADESSLLFIPTGYKESKIYSVFPTTGVGDFTFNRNSSATRIAKNGLITSVATDIPRLEYPLIDGVVNGCPSLLLEPSRTNLVTYSNTTSQWVDSGVTHSANDIISPDGGLNATKSVVNVGVTTANTRPMAAAPITTGLDYVFSVFAKAGEFEKITLDFSNSGFEAAEATYNLTTGTVTAFYGLNVNQGIEDYGNGWYRCYIVATAIATGTTPLILRFDDNPTGNGVDGLYFYGASFEQGSYPTSYIPTNGTTVTRAADTANGAGDATTFNDSEGVLMVETKLLTELGNDSMISLSSVSDDEVRFRFYTSGVLLIKVGDAQPSYDYLFTDNTKLLIKWGNGSFNFFVNGFNVLTQTYSVAPSGINKLNFSHYNLTSFPFYGKTKQIQYFQTALTDSELEELTSWTSFTAMAQGQQYSIK